MVIRDTPSQSPNVTTLSGKKAFPRIASSTTRSPGMDELGCSRKSDLVEEVVVQKTSSTGR